MLPKAFESIKGDSGPSSYIPDVNLPKEAETNVRI